MSEEQKAISVDEARQALENEKAARVSVCEREIQDSLAKYRCQMIMLGLAYSGDGKWMPQFKIVAE